MIPRQSVSITRPAEVLFDKLRQTTIKTTGHPYKAGLWLDTLRTGRLSLLKNGRHIKPTQTSTGKEIVKSRLGGGPG